MPRYLYKCDVCDTLSEEFVPISQYQSEIPCPKCRNGIMMRREYAGQAPGSFNRAFHKPIEMFSIAPETPAELAAFRKRNPDVKLTDQFVPLARSRSEKLRILKNEGYEERN